jgi:hypothetical protein
VAAQNDELGLAITPDTPVARWDGSDLDVSWCVEGLLSLEHRVPARSTAESPTRSRGSSAAWCQFSEPQITHGIISTHVAVEPKCAAVFLVWWPTSYVYDTAHEVTQCAPS